ncbi:hypothetical protein [Dichotomicrobium thermohalophilum]|uniref:Uncharacterized protein n=1 Tax=Dichotomicrobium thermohalophilum TaxID=933063 RepID=A0A397Q4G9_9HYPH|nr:hypothetical protein [Dichotomicrobium thermohalophilum]RIA55843.1 hypothetical protein BXY53_0928 [Dichotomicrobium thermohalophilum]
MILYVMLVALGFLIAMLIALLLAPAFWRRAERLTARRLEQSMPMSIAEAEAERDQIRASYAIIIRRLEAALSQEKMRSARQLVKISRLQMEIADLNDRTQKLRCQLEAEHNAASVLRRTIATRVPELNRAAEDARQLVHVRDREIDTIVNRLRHREEALAIAQRTTEMQQAEIARLRQAMEMSGAQNAGRFKLRPTEWTIHDYRAEYDRLNVELSKLRERLAVAYDREANQIKELRTELQQLADQVVTTASALPESEPQRAIAHDTSEDEPRRLSAPAQHTDALMRSIDAIIADTAGSSRVPALAEPAAKTARAPRSGSTLARAAAAPKRLARGAMQKLAGLAGANRNAKTSAASGSGHNPDPAAPTPGEVSAARLLGGAALSGHPAQPRRVGDFGPSEQESEQEPKTLAGGVSGAGDPGLQADVAATEPQSFLETNRPAPEEGPATEPQAEATTQVGGEEPDEDSSLYDRYRSAKLTSGKLREDPAGPETPPSGNADASESGPSATEGETGSASATPEESESTSTAAGEMATSSGNGVATPESSRANDNAESDASPGSLLHRLKQMPESETR